MPTDPPVAFFNLAAALNKALLLVLGTISGFLGLVFGPFAGAGGVAVDPGDFAPLEMREDPPPAFEPRGTTRLSLLLAFDTLAGEGRVTAIEARRVDPELAAPIDPWELRVLRLRVGPLSEAALNEDGGAPPAPLACIF